jgi:hypothetical protein
MNDARLLHSFNGRGYRLGSQRLLSKSTRGRSLLTGLVELGTASSSHADWIRRRSLGRNGAMIGAVTTITCKRCGLSFQTQATTNTRCRRCRAVVRVPAAAGNLNGSGSRREHTFGVVLLSCGHPAVVIIHPGRSVAATIKRYDWECPDTSASVTATRVLAVLSQAEYENLGQEAFDCSSLPEPRARRRSEPRPSGTLVPDT